MLSYVNVISILKEILEIVRQAEKNGTRYGSLRAKLETLEARSRLRFRHNSRIQEIQRQIRQMINVKQIAAKIKELEEELDSALIAITAFMAVILPGINQKLGQHGGEKCSD
ncbi:839_t:CDS:2 [Ambispora leptoticha]|uniref:839_t:CDS:1 n=1 Tax=Ambispora leptoticha TaxID=144679 RepID=A0A9N8YVK4_9GLOM|nr:839_t:CDS:2 [Ambispora leptoticha]